MWVNEVKYFGVFLGYSFMSSPVSNQHISLFQDGLRSYLSTVTFGYLVPWKSRKFNRFEF